MLVETRARNLTTSPEVVENIRRTRAYLQSLNAPPQPTEQIDDPTRPDWAGAAVVRAVALRTGLDCQSIMLNVEVRGAIEARRVAMAICVLHLDLPIEAIGLIFGVHPDAVARAAEHCRPFYLDVAIPEHAKIVEVVTAFCAHYLGPAPVTPVTARDILREVRRQFGVTELDLRSPRRDVISTRARMVAMLLMKRLTTLSWTEIGRHLARDHSTVVKNWDRVGDRLRAAEMLVPAWATLTQWVEALRNVPWPAETRGSRR